MINEHGVLLLNGFHVLIRLVELLSQYRNFKLEKWHGTAWSIPGQILFSPIFHIDPKHKTKRQKMNKITSRFN